MRFQCGGRPRNEARAKAAQQRGTCRAGEVGPPLVMVESCQDARACYLDHETVRSRTSTSILSVSHPSSPRINRRMIADWKWLRPSGGAKLLSAVAVAATVTGCCVLLSPASAAEPDAGAASDMAVTVARTTNVCFADTLQVTGIVVPRNEILVRPDREGLQISQVLVEPGDTVVSGQVLARLTPPEGQQGGGTTTVAIQAPAAGVVTSRSAVVGTLASARTEPLFRIAAKGEMELLAETPVKTLASVASNQTAKIAIVGVGELPGKVRIFSVAINPTTQLGQIRLFIGSDPKLRVGAFGRATIDVGRRCGPAIPLSAVLYGPGGAVVQVVRDNRIETRRVTVGLLAAGQAEIRDGLAEGEMVVARAGAFVREGDRVRSITGGEPSARQ
jgi:HlyD family secretion protein